MTSTEAFAQAVSAQIRAERAAARLTQEEVAERAEMSKSTFIRLETGERKPDVDQLDRLARAFGVTMTQIIERAESRMSRRTPQHGPSRKAPKGTDAV